MLWTREIENVTLCLTSNNENDVVKTSTLNFNLWHCVIWYSHGLKNGFISGWSRWNAASCAAAIDSRDVILGSAAIVFRKASKFFWLWEDKGGCGRKLLWFLWTVSELELESSDSMIWKVQNKIHWPNKKLSMTHVFVEFSFRMHRTWLSNQFSWLVHLQKLSVHAEVALFLRLPVHQQIRRFFVLTNVIFHVVFRIFI